ncbi:MAG: Tail Collar domain protein [Bacteroidetes bacterium]|nr:Tail Collar domain protein [Bacteroidota bacterium]
MRTTASLPNGGAVTTDYPFGVIVDETSSVAGTALTEATYGDFIQSLWHFVKLADVTPNGVADNTTNGFQLAKAMQMILQPVGTPGHWPVATPPTGWLVMDGAAISRTIYVDLFALIGTTFGTGDGSTTFNLPNEINRMRVGAGDSYAVGATGGSATHTNTIEEMCDHAHKPVVYGWNNQVHGITYGSDVDALVAGSVQQEEKTGGAYDITGTTAVAGKAYSIMNPYLAMYPIIKALYV